MTNKHSVLKVGQVWTDYEGDRVEIVALDDDAWYPVQFKWEGNGASYLVPGMTGRDSVEGFLRDFTLPTSEWLKMLEAK